MPANPPEPTFSWAKSAVCSAPGCPKELALQYKGIPFVLFMFPMKITRWPKTTTSLSRPLFHQSVTRFSQMSDCDPYLDVFLPVELSGSLLWQTTGAVLQWGEHSGGNVDVVTLHGYKTTHYFLMQPPLALNVFKPQYRLWFLYQISNLIRKKDPFPAFYILLFFFKLNLGCLFGVSPPHRRKDSRFQSEH